MKQTVATRLINQIKHMVPILLVVSLISCLLFTGCSPKDDVNSLISKLASKDAKVKADAITASIEINDAKVINSLGLLLKDEDTNIRNQAQSTLIKIGTPAVEALINVLKDSDANIRAKAAEILGTIKDTRAVEPLIALLKDDIVPVRGSAIKALGEIKDSRAVQPLVDLIIKQDQSMLDSIQEVLIKIDIPSVEPLIVILKNKSFPVRKIAVFILGEIRNSKAVNPLISLVQDIVNYPYSDNDRLEEQTTIMEALVKIGAPAVKPLISLLTDNYWSLWNRIERFPNEENGYISLYNRRMIVAPKLIFSTVVKIGEPAILPLTEILNAPNYKFKDWVAYILSQFKNPVAAAALSTILHNKEWEIIAFCLDYYIRIGEPGTEPILLEALNADKIAATTLLNSGNDILISGSRTWATSHGYTIVVTQNSYTTYPKWGSDRIK